MLKISKETNKISFVGTESKMADLSFDSSEGVAHLVGLNSIIMEDYIKQYSSATLGTKLLEQDLLEYFLLSITKETSPDPANKNGQLGQ